MLTPKPGDSGFNTFIESCRKRLRVFIRKRLPRNDDVEDILQEVLYQYIRVNSLMQPLEQAMAWLMKVARNEIIDRSRKITEQQLPEYTEIGEADPSYDNLAKIMLGYTQSASQNAAKSAEDEYLTSLFWDELENALEELPVSQREVFEKTELQGYSFKQLSAMTGVPINTLLSRKHLAILHLRARLQELYAEIMPAAD